ncbi:unnamed protein product [Boreogadus saida]
MSKRTIDSFYRPAAIAASSVPVPQSTESEDDDSEDHVANKGRTQNFREDWLREFCWLRYCKETKSTNCECCSRYPRNAGNTKFADTAVRCKPGGRLAELLADLQAQRRQQEGEREPHPLHKYQGITIKGEAAVLGKEGLSMASTPKLQQAVRATIDCTVLNLKQRFSSLLHEESTSATAKAVKSFKIFSHDSWPEQRDQMTDYGAEELDFLLDNFSSVLTRLVTIFKLS